MDTLETNVGVRSDNNINRLDIYTWGLLIMSQLIMSQLIMSQLSDLLIMSQLSDILNLTIKVYNSWLLNYRQCGNI